MLIETRYQKSFFNVRESPESEIVSYPVYSYESYKNLYDVMKWADGNLYVRVNTGAWSNNLKDWKSMHYSVKEYFGLEAD